MTSFIAELFFFKYNMHLYTVGKFLKIVCHDLLHRICKYWNLFGTHQ